LTERSLTEAAPRPSAAVPGLDLVAELRSTLDRVGELARIVELNLREAVEHGGTGTADERVQELESRLSTAESDVKELASRLVDSEHQGGRLMNLYVATYQLHATLDPAEHLVQRQRELTGLRNRRRLRHPGGPRTAPCCRAAGCRAAASSAGR
jgi:uncharacterized coiled-coil protein SlyX